VPASAPKTRMAKPEAQAAPGRRERKKQDKRDRVRAAAWELFRTRGFDDTTTRDIAREAGIATGTLFLYAKDKVDLLFIVFEHRLRRCVEDGFRTVPALGLVEQLIHLFAGLFDMYGEAPDIGHRFVKELPGAAGENAERVHAVTYAFLQGVAGLVAAAQERGEVRHDVVPMQAAQAAFALYFAALLGWLSGMIPKDFAIGAGLRGGLGLLYTGLRGPDPAAT
jgi:AcrR family transcriptional regulator